ANTSSPSLSASMPASANTTSSVHRTAHTWRRNTSRMLLLTRGGERFISIVSGTTVRGRNWRRRQVFDRGALLGEDLELAHADELAALGVRGARPLAGGIVGDLALRHLADEHDVLAVAAHADRAAAPQLVAVAAPHVDHVLLDATGLAQHRAAAQAIELV